MVVSCKLVVQFWYRTSHNIEYVTEPHRSDGDLTELLECTSHTSKQKLPTPPGDMGSAVTLGSMDAALANLVKEGYNDQGFNQVLSDMISVRRRLPDYRDNWCKLPDRFPRDLPETSIVVVFYNEAWSVLVRTVHSILDRSPPGLVKEIVLVDDFSFLCELKRITWC